MSKVLKVFVNYYPDTFYSGGSGSVCSSTAGGFHCCIGERYGNQYSDRLSGIWSEQQGKRPGSGGIRLSKRKKIPPMYMKLTAIDAENETVEVTAAEGDTPSEIALRTSVRKAVITVPLIGYVSIAMQTAQGRIVLGLAVVLLIVLFSCGGSLEPQKMTGDEEGRGGRRRGSVLC